MKGEVLGGKGVQMDVLQKRLGQTSQSGIKRLVLEQMVKGLEEGIGGDFGMCRRCKMGKSSKKSHPRNDPEYRAKVGGVTHRHCWAIQFEGMSGGHCQQHVIVQV